MEQEYEWTLEDIRKAHRRAQILRLTCHEAFETARSMEQEYWTRKLVSKFPKLEYNTHNVYLATIAYEDGDETCRVVGPEISSYEGVGLRVWHKGSKGKFHKLATFFKCEEIVPFITDVSLLAEDAEAVA